MHRAQAAHSLWSHFVLHGCGLNVHHAAHTLEPPSDLDPAALRRQFEEWFREFIDRMWAQHCTLTFEQICRCS